ncbi:MAG: ubiquinol-cytochrome c reductase iron-sulfur subunit, partial [Pseudomonadota bacterium]
SKRNFLKYLTGAVIGVGATIAAIPFVKFLSPNQYSSAANKLDVDITNLKTGHKMTIIWQKMPIYIVRRSVKTLSRLEKTNLNLRDPDSIEQRQFVLAKNYHRSIKPEILVVVGICTKRDCSVEYSPPGSNTSYLKDFKNGGFFYCACCGSKYDLSGRVVSNVPALYNLDVPKYEVVNEATIRLKV